jgi:hypothetical protein
MSWIQENKFLTGYIAVMAVGVGVLGFKVFSASGALDDANARYTTKAATYDGLRRSPVYPDRDNLAVFEAQKKEAADVITDFQAELAKREFPLQPMSPTDFQDNLKKAVTEATAKAQAANIKVEKFYLGFDRYEKSPPDKDVTEILGRDLKAIAWVVDQFFSAPILELKALTRPELPEEKGKGAPPARPSTGPGNRGTGSDRSHADLVTSHFFDITVVCKQRQLATALNALISAKAPQFYIPRTIRITNQNQKGPLRVDPNAVAPVVPENPVAGAPAAPIAKDLQYIVGEEWNEVTLRIEIVDFADPAIRTTK